MWKSKLIMTIKHGLTTGKIRRNIARELCVLASENRPFRLLYNNAKDEYFGIEYF